MCKSCAMECTKSRRAWSKKEDKMLVEYVQVHGPGQWSSLPKNAGLQRSGKSCRFRWMNYLRPNIKRGSISSDEEQLIIRLHSLLGNRWSLIAGRLPGRTANEIKNYWNSYLHKKLSLCKPSEKRSEAPNFDGGHGNESQWLIEKAGENFSNYDDGVGVREHLAEISGGLLFKDDENVFKTFEDRRHNDAADMGKERVGLEILDELACYHCYTERYYNEISLSPLDVFMVRTSNWLL